jgi:hypothetical protein
MATDQTQARDHPASGVVPGTSVRLGGTPARVGAPAPLPAEPSIEVVRAGDVIQAIDIVCVCGQHIRLHCLYE